MIKKLVPAFFVLFCTCSQAQYNKNGAIHVFVPTKQTEPPTRANLDSERHVYKNCLKWNWSLLTRGTFLINYETWLTGNLSAQVGVGITYEDFLYEATYNSTSGDFSSNASYGSPGPGLAGEAGLRYYPSGYDNLEGFFIEATVSYRTYSFSDAKFANATGYIEPGYDFFDEQFKLGRVSSPLFSDFVSEFYVGIGIRNATVRSYQSELLQAPGSHTATEIYQPQTAHATYPQPLLGFKLGYQF